MAIHGSPPAASWVQLTYTSADAIAGVKGGWGVKETLPSDADAKLVSVLTEGVIARIEEVVETSQFASEADLAARARRLAFKVVDGVLVMWHSISAGLDATGRPGNVYNHAAALTRESATVRAIEYWRSPDWLVPFGAANVTAARLGELNPGGAISRDSTVRFLRANDRVFSLEWILAAVSHACSAGGTLAFVADTPDEAASWIGAISYLTSPGLARRISFVTFERAARVGDNTLAGFRVVAVPRTDLAALKSAVPSSLIVDPTWSLDDPETGDYRTPLGQTFAPDRRWQTGLIDLFALDDDEQILRILAASDHITASFSPRELAALPLHWSLSMAMLADPEVQVFDRPGLTLECLSVAPASAPPDAPGIQLLLDRVVAELRGDNDWDQVLRGQVGPRLQRAAAAARMRDFLEGGWQTQRSPGLAPALISAALDDCEGSIPTAVGAALGILLGTADQVLSSGRVVSLLLDYPGPGRGGAKIETLVAGLRSRLSAPDMARFADEISSFNPRLSAAAVASRPVAQSPQTMGNASNSHWRESLAPAAANVRPSTSAGSFMAAPTPGQPATVPLSPIPQEPWALADDLGTALAELLVEAEVGTDRYAAIADAIRVQRGLRSVPLGRSPQGGHRSELVRAEAEWRDSANPGPVRVVFSSWLSTHYAMIEAEGSGVFVPTNGLAEDVSAWLEPHLAELTRFLEGAPAQQVAEIAASSMREEFEPSRNSIIGARSRDGRMLGWTAVLAAIKRMTPERHIEVWQYLEPEAVRGEGAITRSPVDEYFDHLRPPGANTEGAAPAGTRARRH